MSNNERVKMIEAENLIKIYKTSDIEVVALQGLDLVVEEGELMAIIGNSGSGKSTLLNMIGGLDRPTAGKLFVDGKDLFKLTEKQMVMYKKETVGFVWQNNARNLIPYLTAKENVELAQSLSSRSHKHTAVELLEMVSLSHRKNNVLGQLSGGEQQRVAIAIALSNDPRLLLADEPTGAVDSKTSDQIMDLFRDLNRNLNLTIVIVTHDRSISKKVDRVVAIRDGRTSSEFIRKKTYAEELEEIAQGIEQEHSEETHVELAVLDKAGRLQLPSQYLSALNVHGAGKLHVELEDNRIVLYAPEEKEAASS
jgi:ABC-type lipoprotein export system ATPase subunit